MRLREEHGYSAERLCKEAKIAKQKLSRLENARVRPDQDRSCESRPLSG
ncbi:helix-turn-helix domain-containing protein [Salinispora arenicola]|nr:helix-turn-helix transcriptional regulator [Salinispora arenicola]